MSEVVIYKDAVSIKEHISSVLVNLKKKFSLFEDQEDGALVFELDVNPKVVFIEVSYFDEHRNFSLDAIEILFYTEPNSCGFIFYESRIDSFDTENLTGLIESEIEELLEQSKFFNKAINKINKKIQAIEEICNESGLDFNDFITVEYEFDE